MPVNRHLKVYRPTCSSRNHSRSGESTSYNHDFVADQDRNDTYTINTSSYFFTAFAFLPLLSAAKSKAGYPEPGNVVNLSSMSGITVTSQRGQFNYNAGKAATISLSKMLAAEFARRDLGVRVNCICPGYFPSVSIYINIPI
jgi:NAD(P)-dependent dehydrogenase (short-subunit alcohol dehydrogenase family)